MDFALYAPYLKLIHIVGAFFMVSGIIGRETAYLRAKKATDIKIVAEMMQLVLFFTNKMVAPFGQVVLWAGIITAVAQGWPLFGFLQGGSTNWVLASLILEILILGNVFGIMRPLGLALGKTIGPAIGQGKITPELTAAMNNPKRHNAQIAEYIFLVLIILLMVLKPF